MKTHRTLIARVAGSIALAFAMGIPAAAAAPTPAPAAVAAALSRVHIGNFGKVDDLYYRGAQPDGHDYTDLASLGVKTVIDLTRDGRDDEKGFVERAGMSFMRIPMTTSDRPQDAAVKQFLSIVNDPERQPVYVHCQGGQHRTGVMTAVYRMTKYGWDEEKAYDEMKQYKFETFWGHPELRSFVHDFYSKLTPVKSDLVAAVAVPTVDAHRPSAD